MFRTVKFCLAVAIIVSLFGAGVFAQAPGTMTYQGKLTDEALNAITVETEVTFRIWDADVEGTELWLETQLITPNEQGVFTVELGGTVPFPAGLFDGSVRYLGIQVGTDDEMTPRQAITSSPYSMRSNVSGACYSFRSYYGLTETVAAIDTLTVAIPSNGYLVMELTGWCIVYPNTTDFNWFDISISSSSDTWNQDSYARIVAEPDAAGAGKWETYSVRLFTPVVPGEYTYYVLMEKFAALSASAYDMHFTAFFFPTWIGVEPPVVITAGSEDESDSEPAPTPGK